jgi:hypothetical protein
VEEIKNDLGVKADQYSQNLRDQGIYATKLDTKGGVEDESSAGGPTLASHAASRNQKNVRPFTHQLVLTFDFFTCNMLRLLVSA